MREIIIKSSSIICLIIGIITGLTLSLFGDENSMAKKSILNHMDKKQAVNWEEWINKKVKFDKNGNVKSIKKGY